MTEETNSTEQAAQAPDVATSGATEPVGTVEPGEKEAEQQEHLERRVNPQLPDPQAEAVKPDSAQTDPSTQTFLSDPTQLASDGDAVKPGLPDDGQEAGA